MSRKRASRERAALAGGRDARAPSREWQLRLPGGRCLELGGVDGAPRVMGIVNVTPDSFSDGGLYLEQERAVEHGRRLLAEGADILDLGAESTRPGGGVYGDGADEISASEEIERLLGVLEALRRETGAILSVDTRKGEVARAALEAGADLINDVGGLADPELARAVAEAGCPLVLMHSRGELRSMQREVRFGDVVAEVRDELAAGVRRAVSFGIPEEQVVVDPGIGFGKTARQNLRLIAELGRLGELGRPVLLGASRKSFIAQAALSGSTVSPGDAPPPGERLGGSLAAAVAGRGQGAAILRVHDVAATVQLLRVLDAIDGAAGGAGVGEKVR